MMVATVTPELVGGPVGTRPGSLGDRPGSLEDEIARLLGQPWDDELEPFRCAGDGAPVRWLHATGGTWVICPGERPAAGTGIRAETHPRL